MPPKALARLVRLPTPTRNSREEKAGVKMSECFVLEINQ